MSIREQLGAPKTGDWLPIVKFDALAGRFWRVDKDLTGQPVLGDLLNKVIAIDLASAEFGWLKFGPTGPIRQMTPMGGAPVPAPEERDDKGKLTFRAGFYTKVCGQCLDGIREWCSATGVLIDTFDALWDQYVAAPEAHDGKIPLISIIGSTPVVRGSGSKRQTTYTPQIEVRSWVERPAALGAATVVLPKPGAPSGVHTASPQQAAPATAPAPKPAPAPQPAMADDVMPF